ncbi:hypothetical protein C7B76_09180 [filamentous cyanobacterium CCP2]|nr:hypothetical protein C7B76_09180 [filamentous cyanobacterium CCP2]
MTFDLQRTINLARSLSLAEQLELLKVLSNIIQEKYSLETQTIEEEETDFSADSFRQSWQQAMNGQTLPLSAL